MRAATIGPARGAFTTQESVDDIEALRQAAGYEKLVLYGTSYGTKVALEYAERYPSTSRRWCSTRSCPPNGPEPFALADVPGDRAGARASCARTAPAPASPRTRSPTSRGWPRGCAGTRCAAPSTTARAAATPPALSEGGLLEILQAGDLNPALRALLPAAVRSALRGDPDPLLRLHLLSEGLIPNVPSAARDQRTQRESTKPCSSRRPARRRRSRGSAPHPPSTRVAEAAAALNALPRIDFYPFDPRTALDRA